MAWNFDMAKAPKGSWQNVERTVGKAIKVARVHTPELIIAAGNGGVVTISRWLPEEERWNMFTKDVPPLAWQPWPKHPSEEQA